MCLVFVISPYAKRGYIDHQTLSFDAYLKFIEDDFLGGQRLDPKTDKRPDPRPNVRENASILGNLASEFNFNQAPLAPVILPQQIVAPIPGKAKGDWVMGTITKQSAHLIKLQISSTEKSAQSLLGNEISLQVPAGTPIYFGGKYAPHSKLAVGDAVVAIIVDGAKNHIAHALDDLGR